MHMTLIIITILFLLEIIMECRNAGYFDDDYYENDDSENV